MELVVKYLNGLSQDQVKFILGLLERYKEKLPNSIIVEICLIIYYRKKESERRGGKIK